MHPHVGMVKAACKNTLTYMGQTPLFMLKSKLNNNGLKFVMVKPPYWMVKPAIFDA